MLALTGCGLLQPAETRVETKPVSCIRPPGIAPLAMRPTPPTVISDTQGRKWFAFGADEYENLALNIQDMRQHANQLRAVIRYYRECNDGSLPANDIRDGRAEDPPAEVRSQHQRRAADPPGEP